MDNLIIRPATMGDFDVIDQFQVGLIDFERQFDSTIAAGKDIRYYPRAEIEERISNKQLLVAEIDGKVVGCGFEKIETSSWASPKQSGQIRFIFVDPPHRGKGIASAILKKLIEQLKAKGVAVFKINAYCDNHNAVELYKKLGFKSHHVQLCLIE